MATARKQPPAPISLTERRIADLESMRMMLIAACDLEPKAVPALSKELRAVNAELAELTKGVEVSGVDDLRDRRAQRIAKPKAPTRSKRSS